MIFTTNNPRRNKRVKKWFGYRLDDWCYGKIKETGDRDFQKNKVYRAEHYYYKGTNQSNTFHSKDEVINFIKSLINSDEFVEIYGEFYILEVLLGEDKGRECNGICYVFDTNIIAIALPKWTWNIPSIIHELAHSVGPYGVKHGPLYCYNNLILTKMALGEDTAKDLQEVYDSFGIFYEPYKLVKDLKPKVKYKRSGLYSYPVWLLKLATPAATSTINI
jgi:hypothetical protein